MSRTRTRETIYGETGGVQNISGKRYNGANPATNLSASTSFYSDHMNETITDVVTPNFKARSKAGEIINNPYSKLTVLEANPKPTTYSRAQLTTSGGKIYGDTWDGSWPMEPAFLGDYLQAGSLPEFQSMVNSLVSRAVSSAYANTSQMQMDIQTTAAEYMKSVNSLFDIFVRAIKLFRAVRKVEVSLLRQSAKGYLTVSNYKQMQAAKDFVAKQKTAQELSDRYMELRYALRPLAYDARNLTRALTKTLGTGIRCTGRGVASDTFNLEDTWHMADGNFDYVVDRSIHVTTRVRAGVLCSVDLTNSSVFGLDQLNMTIWELLPMTFILDWFWNIGTIVASLTPSAGVTNLASWYTVEHTAILENSLGSIKNAVHTNYADRITWSGRKSRTELWKERFINPSPGALPKLNVRLDSLKLLDLAKILSNLRTPVR